MLSDTSDDVVILYEKQYDTEYFGDNANDTNHVALYGLSRSVIATSRYSYFPL